MHPRFRTLLFIGLGFALGCQKGSTGVPATETPTGTTDGGSGEETSAPLDAEGAHVTAVSTTGKEGSRMMAVSLLSHDTGCEHYADWWEVLDENGALIYRRILNHSHPDEQPFTRDGGSIEAQDATVLIVRGHMNDSSYGGVAFRGTMGGGFAEAPDVSASFASEVASQPPLPKDCWY